MKTLIRTAGLPFLMAVFVIGLFIFQWNNLEQIRQQVAAGLRAGLGQIADETAHELSVQIENDIKQSTRLFHKIADSSVWDIKTLHQAGMRWNNQIHEDQLTGEVLLAIRNQKGPGGWDIISPGTSYQQNVNWMQDLFWAVQIEDQLSPYDLGNANFQSYWEQTLDSLIFIQPKHQIWEQKTHFVCQPVFEMDATRLLALVCHPVNQTYLKNHLIPSYFQHTFPQEKEERPDGIRRAFLHAKLVSQQGELYHNSAVRGRTSMEHHLDLSKSSPYLHGLTFSLGFLGTSSESVASTLHQRNQWLLVGVLSIFLALIYLIYRTLRKAQKLDKLKSHFLANVTHELKTPLSGIMLANDTLRLNRISRAEDIHETSEIIYQESRRLQNLVNKILDFSERELNLASIHPESLHVNEWLDEQLFVYRKRAEGEGFVWRESLQIQAVTLNADPVALQTVVEILIDNAVRYSQDKKSIYLKTEIRDGQWVLRIKDEGPGIPYRHQLAVFDKFVRLDNSDVHDTKGMGIGLSIAKTIVEAHGGIIRLDSKPGFGSTFSIHLPL